MDSRDWQLATTWKDLTTGMTGHRLEQLTEQVRRGHVPVDREDGLALVTALARLTELYTASWDRLAAEVAQGAAAGGPQDGSTGAPDAP